MTTDRLGQSRLNEAVRAVLDRRSAQQPNVGTVTTGSTASGAALPNRYWGTIQPALPSTPPVPGGPVGVIDYQPHPITTPGTGIADAETLRRLIEDTEAILEHHGVTKKSPKSKRASPKDDPRSDIALVDVQEFMREHADKFYIHVSHVAERNKIQISLRMNEKQDGWAGQRSLVVHDFHISDSEVELIAAQVSDAAARVLGEREAKLRSEAQALRDKLAEIERKLHTVELSKTAVGNGERLVEETANRNRKLAL